MSLPGPLTARVAALERELARIQREVRRIPGREALPVVPRQLARWVRVKLSAAMTTSDEKVDDCQVLEFTDGRDPGGLDGADAGTVNIYNTEGESPSSWVLNLASGTVLWCFYNNKSNHYEALSGGEASCPEESAECITAIGCTSLTAAEMIENHVETPAAGDYAWGIKMPDPEDEEGEPCIVLFPIESCDEPMARLARGVSAMVGHGPRPLSKISKSKRDAWLARHRTAVAARRKGGK